MNPVAETLADPMLGRLIDGRYEVREKVATGGMATVYLAFDRRLERQVAIKLLNTMLVGQTDPHEFASRFRREAKAAARLTHPGMVRVYDQGTDGDIAYLTMEYVEGENLRTRLAHEATLPVGEALDIIEQVLDALAAVHRQGLVHRDVKPENVLLDGDGRAKLADFGLARAVTEVTSTATGTIMGTVAYLGPELIARGYADARTDVYSCGILLFEMLTGRQPFTGGSAIDIASRHVHEDIPVPSVYVPWLPPELDDVVLAFASRDPARRPADASAALGIIRHTRAMIDDPTLDRRADPPSGQIPLHSDDDATTVLEAVPAGATIALPIGLGEPLVDLGGIDAEILDDDPDAVPPQREGPRLGVWIGGLLAGLVLIGSLGTWWYATQGPGAYTTVPKVEGMLQADAELALDSIGLQVEVLTENSDTVTAGFVIRTNPPAQTEVPNGDTVTLVVSAGPRMARVPDVEGLTEAAARAALAEAGFTGIITIEREYDDLVPAGDVLTIDPSVDEELPHFTAITLTVSDGPEPVTMPDVVTMTGADAVAYLAETYAMDVVTVFERTLDQPKGLVFKTDPAPGSGTFRTASVTIYVSDGLPLVKVPDFSFNRVSQAKETAEGLGLVVELRKANNYPWTTPEFVVDQSIKPGTEVEHGTTIILYYDS